MKILKNSLIILLFFLIFTTSYASECDPLPSSSCAFGGLDTVLLSIKIIFNKKQGEVIYLHGGGCDLSAKFTPENNSISSQVYEGYVGELVYCLNNQKKDSMKVKVNSAAAIICKIEKNKINCSSKRNVP